MATRIMVSGAVASQPLFSGGNTWAFLQYVLGLRRLGIIPYYVEQIDREDCIDENWHRTTFDDSVNVRYFRALIERFDLMGYAALLEYDGPGHVGLSHAEVQQLAPDIDLLINMSGRLHIQQILNRVRRRLYLDMDPGYTQIWQEQYGIDMNLRGHDLYATVGLNLSEPECPFPTCGVRWEKTLPPVVIDEWRGAQTAGDFYSTIADWRGFGAVEWHGVWYGQKSDEFLRVIDLPRKTSVKLELCLFIHPGEQDRTRLEKHGWRLASPELHAANVEAYQKYIFASRGEFTAVKQGYSAGRTGWFSDRSACYLAAGRPVITQDTGIGRHLPTGMGLLTFDGLAAAVDALEKVENNYTRHATAAAAFAREYLDSNVVLSRLLSLAGV
jgi:hypothetical protein